MRKEGLTVDVSVALDLHVLYFKSFNQKVKVGLVTFFSIFHRHTRRCAAIGDFGLAGYDHQ